jgi:hypothetical protein
MAMSIDALKFNLTNPARDYEWEVTFPTLIGGGDKKAMSVRCRSAVIPGRGFGEILIPFRGTPGISIPGKATVPHAWTATFIEGTDKKVFDAINKWNERIRAIRSGMGSSDLQIKTDIIMKLLDRAGAAYLAIKLVGVYPRNVDDVPVSNDNEGIVTYNVTFAYDFWEEASSGISVNIGVNVPGVGGIGI